jgi:hypothetical protein
MNQTESLAWAFTTRLGQAATVCAGVALWAVAWPVFVPLVAIAVVSDALDARRNR